MPALSSHHSTAIQLPFSYANSIPSKAKAPPMLVITLLLNAHCIHGGASEGSYCNPLSSQDNKNNRHRNVCTECMGNETAVPPNCTMQLPVWIN